MENRLFEGQKKRFEIEEGAYIFEPRIVDPKKFGIVKDYYFALSKNIDGFLSLDDLTIDLITIGDVIIETLEDNIFYPEEDYYNLGIQPYCLAFRLETSLYLLKHGILLDEMITWQDMNNIFKAITKDDFVFRFLENIREISEKSIQIPPKLKIIKQMHSKVHDEYLFDILFNF